MFSTSIQGQPGATADFFLLPPTAGSSLQSARAIEEVRFARDEMADMWWGIEGVLENSIGEPWGQNERDVAAHGNPSPPAGTQGAAVPLRYSIETRVPDYWFPLMPISVDPTKGSVALQLGTVIPAAGGTAPNPRGRILNPTAIGKAVYQMPEEEVPRNGVRVQRVVCRSRWIDGSTALWQLRRVQPGTGEVQSGLSFDLALPNP
jgi:hypothetical protein